MHLATGHCDRCTTRMTAFSDEFGVLEILNIKCSTCRTGRVLTEVMKDAASDTVVPSCKVASRAPLPPTAIIHIQPNGDVHYLTTAGVEMIVVDERVPEDRAYRITDEGIECQADVERLTDGIVGSKHEPRHAAMAARIRAMAEGRNALTVIRGQPPRLEFHPTDKLLQRNILTRPRYARGHSRGQYDVFHSDTLDS